MNEAKPHSRKPPRTARIATAKAPDERQGAPNRALTTALAALSGRRAPGGRASPTALLGWSTLLPSHLRRPCRSRHFSQNFSLAVERLAGVRKATASHYAYGAHFCFSFAPGRTSRPCPQATPSPPFSPRLALAHHAAPTHRRTPRPHRRRTGVPPLVPPPFRRPTPNDHPRPHHARRYHECDRRLHENSRALTTRWAAARAVARAAARAAAPPGDE